MNEAKIVEECKNLFESITCLRVEGVKFFTQKEILDSICREAMKGYDLCKNHLITVAPDAKQPLAKCSLCGKELNYCIYCEKHERR